MICTTQNAAVRRYSWRLLGAMLTYALFLCLAVWEFTHRHPTGAFAYLLAVLPSLPIIGGLVVVGQYLAEEKDEFQRAVLVQSMLWGIGATLAVTSVWGFLENFIQVQHFDL